MAFGRGRVGAHLKNVLGCRPPNALAQGAEGCGGGNSDCTVRRFRWCQPGHRVPTFGNDNGLSARDLVKQCGKVGFRLERADFSYNPS